MKSLTRALAGTALALLVNISAPAAEDLLKSMDALLQKAPAEGHWLVKADELDGWMKAKKTDFLVVDVRPAKPGKLGGSIPGALSIPYNDILKPENLAKLPKDKKLILACMTGQTQNLPMLALRALGYDARTLMFGHTAWIKGYLGAQQMQDAIQNAATKAFPLEK